MADDGSFNRLCYFFCCAYLRNSSLHAVGFLIRKVCHSHVWTIATQFLIKNSVAVSVNPLSPCLSETLSISQKLPTVILFSIYSRQTFFSSVTWYLSAEKYRCGALPLLRLSTLPEYRKFKNSVNTSGPMSTMSTTPEAFSLVSCVNIAKKTGERAARMLLWALKSRSFALRIKSHKFSLIKKSLKSCCSFIKPGIKIMINYWQNWLIIRLKYPFFIIL